MNILNEIDDWFWRYAELNCGKTECKKLFRISTKSVVVS